MFCKNCGKEMKDSAAFCPECGAKAEPNAVAQEKKIDAGAFQSAMANSGGTVAVKKKSKTKWLVIGIIVLVIIVIACAVGGDSNDNVIESDNYNGMSFNYTLSEWCDRFNESLKKVDNEFETETNIKIKSTSFQLDNTDYDTTDANVVRYYYEGNYKNENDFAISLYVDTDTEKVCKCDIVNVPFNGDDLTMFVHFCLIPAVMATSHIDYDTACSIMGDVFSSDNHTYYSNNICYQFGSTSTYDTTSIQTVSQEVYDERY